MRIQSKIRGDMVGFSLKHNADNGTRFANVAISVGCDQTKTKKLFGEEIAALAFGSMRTVESEGDEDEGAGIQFAYKKQIPSAICEMHQISLCGHGPLMAQPEIVSITPVKGDEKVIVTIKLPILIKKDTKLAGDLATQFGELVDVDFNPVQQKLNLVEGGASEGVAIKNGPFGNPSPVATGA